jgi:dCTP deaminase
VSEPPLHDGQFQPASIDLRLGTIAYQVRASFLPFLQTVQGRLNEAQVDFTDPDLVIDRLSLTSPVTLQRGLVYLVPLLESLKLPRHVRGRCNPKSTTGRLDIFTRVITDNTPRFDEIQAGYRGPLYVEMSPKSFPIRVQAGISLSQLRLIVGDSTQSDEELKTMHGSIPLLYDDDGEPIAIDDLIVNGGICMGVDLSGRQTDGIIGYRAHPNPPAVDLTKVDYHDPADFWEPIRIQNRRSFILEADRFYILVSKERIRVLPDYAAEMAVYDASAGEIRTHYAGFFDPGFGFGDGSILGTKVVMEVRARDVPVMLYDDQTLFTVRFELLRSRPERLYGTSIGSSYQEQTLTLSKQFRRVSAPDRPGGVRRIFI